MELEETNYKKIQGLRFGFVVLRVRVGVRVEDKRISVNVNIPRSSKRSLVGPLFGFSH